MLRSIVVIALVLGLCGAAFAVPSLNVASGGVQLPDASVAPKGAIEVSAAYVRSEGTNDLVPELNGGCNGNGYNARVLGGIFNRVELGAGYLGINKEIGEANAWTVAAKWKIIDKPDAGLGLALGAAYRGWTSDLMPFGSHGPEIELPNVFSAYLVLDKAWPTSDESDWQTTTSLGLMYDRYAETGTSELKGEVTPNLSERSLAARSPFQFGACAKGFINPIFGVTVAKAGWSFIAEFKPRLQDDGFFYQKDIWTAAIRKQCSGGLAFTTGVTNFNLPYTNSDPGFFFDLTYKFGK